MIIDSRLEFSDGQTVSASAASTNTLNLSAAGDAVNELFLVVIVDTASAAGDGDTETVTAKLQMDDNSSFTDATDLTAAVDCASASDGTTVLVQRLPRGLDEQYLRMYYTVGGDALTTDPVITAFLTDNPQANDLSDG